MDYARVIDEIFSQFQGPRFSVRLWNGTAYSYGSGTKDAFALILKNKRAAQKLLAQGALGFGEAYMDGSLEIEGDIEEYFRLRHQFKHVRRSVRLFIATMLASLSVPRDRKEQIAYHYDLGNDFFRFFLDEATLSYSAGKYESGSETLDDAQQNKLAFIADSLNLSRGSTVLDLGSGWGGFALYAAQQRGWNIESYTLSREQLAYARDIIRTHGVESQVTFAYKDMLEALPEARFDGVAMIESVEHVGKNGLPNFFAALYRSLKPGSPAVLQFTGRYKPRAVDRWTLKYVFPGGHLPAKQELLEAAVGAGFVVEDVRDDTPDYIKTMTEWIRRLESHQAEIERMFDEPFYRLWYLWMHGAKVAFEINSMNLFRVRFRRPQ